MKAAHRHTATRPRTRVRGRSAACPRPLPAGETLLWQGSPDWRMLARRAFHLRKLALYFAALVVLRAAFVLGDGGSARRRRCARRCGRWRWPALALGLVALMAWLSARATVYTLTDKRVVMRIGIVLTLTFNLPFKRIAAAGLHLDADGSGDLPLTLLPGDRIAYLHLWPHARPWRLARPEPMLRSVPEAQRGGAAADRRPGPTPPAWRRGRAPRPSPAPRHEPAQPATASRRWPAAEAATDADHERRLRPAPRRATACRAARCWPSARCCWPCWSAWPACACPACRSARPTPSAVATRSLRFEDRPDGSVAVLDATQRRSRSMPSRARPASCAARCAPWRASAASRAWARSPPFELIARADGRLTLVDPATGERVDLESFGPTNAGAFARLLTAQPAAALTADQEPPMTASPDHRHARRSRAQGQGKHAAQPALLHHRLRGDGPHRRGADPRRVGRDDGRVRRRQQPRPLPAQRAVRQGSGRGLLAGVAGAAQGVPRVPDHLGDLGVLGLHPLQRDPEERQQPRHQGADALHGARRVAPCRLHQPAA